MGVSAKTRAGDEMLRGTGAMTTDALELFVLTLTDMRPSEAPDWADRDWWRQQAIDWADEQIEAKGD